MADSWASWGLDLQVDFVGSRVKRASLEQALRAAVHTGKLPAGARLPSSRALARDLGVSRNTVAEAYGQLVAEGWLTARRGSATHVSDRLMITDPVSSAATTPRSEGYRHDLRPGSPDVSSFPRAAWAAATRAALRDAPDAVFGYGDPRGVLRLREALATYLARARGVRADPRCIVVCSGFTQGLGLLCTALKDPDATTFAVEAYGQPAHRDVIAAAGHHVAALPVDDDGARFDDAGDAAACLLTPAHQFPLGAVLAPERRSAAIRWAEETGGLVIEDDYDGEFRYDHKPIGALQSLAPERVVYAGTASKTLAPGLRLSWLVVPGHLIDEVVAAKALADRQSEAIGQLTLAAFITSGQYDRHVRRQRHAYRRRRDLLEAALHGQTPDVQISGASAGLHLLAGLPAGTDEEEIIARAASRGLAVEGLGSYSLFDHRPPALVIGYATPPGHDYANAVAALCSTLRDSGPWDPACQR